jgi:hypothetical protein
VDLYRDESPDIAVRKPTQCGITTWLIVDAFRFAIEGLRYFYVLPTIDLRNSVVADRVDRAIADCPEYQERITETDGMEGIDPIDNRGLKTWGATGTILFVGSNSRKSFLSYPADVIAIDERNECNEDNLALAPDRLMESNYKYSREVGVPTYPDRGIDATFSQSDRKRWTFRCGSCRTHQELSFFDNIVRQTADEEWELLDTKWEKRSPEDAKVFCRKCGGILNRLGKAEWIPEDQQADISGYTLSRLINPQSTIGKIWLTYLEALKNESKLQRFHNSILGLPYSAKGRQLTQAILDLCVKAGGNYGLKSTGKNTFMGVDVGKVNYVVIEELKRGGIRKPIWIGTVRSLTELDDKVKQFKVGTAVVDARPETSEARRFVNRMKGKCKVWLCEYSKDVLLEEPVVKEEERIIQVDRTQAIDSTVSGFLGQEILLPGNASTLDGGELYRQLQAPVRIMDPTGKRYVWDEGTKQDHYFHGFVYADLAIRIKGRLPTPRVRLI